MTSCSVRSLDSRLSEGKVPARSENARHQPPELLVPQLRRERPRHQDAPRDIHRRSQTDGDERCGEVAHEGGGTWAWCCGAEVLGDSTSTFQRTSPSCESLGPARGTRHVPGTRNPELQNFGTEPRTQNRSTAAPILPACPPDLGDVQDDGLVRIDCMLTELSSQLADAVDGCGSISCTSAGAPRPCKRHRLC